MKSELIRLRLYRVYFKAGYIDTNNRVYNIYNFRKSSKNIYLGKTINRDSNNSRYYIEICGVNIKEITDNLFEIKNAIKDIVEVNNRICKVIR